MTKATYERLFVCLTIGIFTWMTVGAMWLFGRTAFNPTDIFAPPPEAYFTYFAAAIIVYILFALAASVVLAHT